MAPNEAVVHSSLGIALAYDRRFDEAITQLEESLAIAPETTTTLNDLAWVLLTCPEERFRNGSRAIQLAEKADQLSNRNNALYARTLAAAYAATGRFSEAIAVAERGVELATKRGNSALASTLRSDLDLYRRGLPRR
jgi:spermidine synthase